MSRRSATSGLDVRYALTPHLSAYGTVNPDFATVEADQELVNLTRFEVSLTEKRQFFLEGGEQFGQGIRTFYSRRISDIEGGGKLLGKQGPWAMHVLAARAEPLLAGSGAGYAVARAQRDVGSRSTVGVLFANRTLDGLNQGSIGADTSLYFTENWGLTGQLVHSYGRFDEGTTAFFARPAYDSATAHFHVGYTHLGDRLADNVNAIGFIFDDDRRQLDSALNKTVWPADGPVERVQYDSAYDVYWGQTGVLRSWQVDESVAVDFRNRGPPRRGTPKSSSASSATSATGRPASRSAGTPARTSPSAAASPPAATSTPTSCSRAPWPSSSRPTAPRPSTSCSG